MEPRSVSDGCDAFEYSDSPVGFVQECDILWVILGSPLRWPWIKGSFLTRFVQSLLDYILVSFGCIDCGCKVRWPRFCS